MIVEVLRMLRKDVSTEPQLDNTYLPPRRRLFVAHCQSLMNGIRSGSLVPRIDGYARAEATVAIRSSELWNDVSQSQNGSIQRGNILHSRSEDDASPPGIQRTRVF